MSCSPGGQNYRSPPVGLEVPSESEGVHETKDAEGPARGKGGAREESSAETDKTADQAETLKLLLQHAKPNSQTVSKLSQTKDGFPLCWLSMCSLQQDIIRPFVPFKSFDLSGSSLAPRRLFFLLSFLPASTEELTFGRRSVKGGALPLLCGFLGSLTEGGAEGKGNNNQSRRGPRVKKLNFAAGSVSHVEATELFASLPPFLLSLSLKDNTDLGNEGLCALAEAVRVGKAESLVHLILDNTGGDQASMEALWGALWGCRPLKIQALSLNATECSSRMIRSVLHSCRDTLPDIKHLGLASCGLWAPDLSHSIRSGYLRLLETLELDKREFSSGLTTAFTKCLRACFLPHLKNLIFLSGDDSYEDNHDQTSEIIEALKRQDRPPFENVRLTLGSVSEPEARLLGSGALKFIKHLQMDLEAFQLTAFMEALVSAPEEPSLEGLAAGLWVVDGEALGAVRKAILSGRLGALAHLGLWNDGSGGQQGERAAFWSAVSEGFRKKNSLSSVCLRGWGWGQAHELGQAAQGGFLSNVKELTLAEGPFDQSTLFSLCSAVNAMERGLIHLETVDVSRTQVGDGVGFLVESLERGKLPKLIRLLLNDSGITDVCLERFGVAVAGGHMSKIEDLNLSSGSFGPTGIDAFVGAVCAREEGLPQMKHLDLSQRQQQQPGGEWVYGRLSTALQMRKFACLESLNLASVWMHHAAAEEFFGTLRGKNAPMSLRFLNLSGNPIPVVTLSNFVTACSPDTLPNLRQFHLLHIWRQPNEVNRLFQQARTEGKFPALKKGVYTSTQQDGL